MSVQTKSVQNNCKTCNATLRRILANEKTDIGRRKKRKTKVTDKKNERVTADDLDALLAWIYPSNYSALDLEQANETGGLLLVITNKQEQEPQLEFLEFKIADDDDATAFVVDIVAGGDKTPVK
ncbi:hypothetical protein EVAR_49496_1 [Eumeta japonica]|uniref:Uncharacterized protein n=1 Tax=Eumeta variegata TaxID=151549 RepID=A0A4C1VV28_EUMVA|nr:hypothetical protein EVAR_49496_1 [Eumeta japonica]